MQHAVEQDPLNVTWRAILAHTLSTAEMYDLALEELRRALELDENHWLPNFILAETHLESGNLSEAVAVLEKKGVALHAVERRGDAATLIVDEAEQEHADLIVMGTRGLSATIERIGLVGLTVSSGMRGRRGK